MTKSYIYVKHDYVVGWYKNESYFDKVYTEDIFPNSKEKGDYKISGFQTFIASKIYLNNV